MVGVLAEIFTGSFDEKGRRRLLQLIALSMPNPLAT